MRPRLLSLAAVVLSAGLAASAPPRPAGLEVAPAQGGELLLPPCIHGDDNFGLGCCTEPAPFFPAFPAVSSLGKYACTSDCDVSQEHLVKVTLDQPVFVLCDTATIAARITPVLGSGLPPISGRLIAKYSRTWQLTGDGIQQVWRFLLNGDLAFEPVDPSQMPCPVPPQSPASSSDKLVTHHFFGHVDYVCDPTQSHVELLLDSLSLSHLPGCISHAPGTARPRTGDAAHYRNGYHIVAPSNFAFGPTGNIPGGAVSGDAVRDSFVGGCFPSTYSCVGEARVLGGEYFSANCDVCLCSSFPCTGPWRHYGMSVPVECGKEQQIMTGAAGVHPVAPEGLVGLSLGAWSGGAGPLASTDLVVEWGAVDVGKPCHAEKPRAHTVMGVATRSVPGSEPVLFQSASELPPDWFIDLENSLVPASVAPQPTPCQTLQELFGAPAYADLVIQLNT